MFYKKQGFPEERDIVLCTVKKILPNSIFVNLDEYKDKEGLIHISEISAGRIRNIRDYVKENKKIICKVLKVDKYKNHIDVSLRRVSSVTKKNKLTEIKQEEKSEKILELISKELKSNLENTYQKIGYKIIEKYGSLYNCFQSIVSKNDDLKDLNLPSEYTNLLISKVKEKIKPPEVKIMTKLNLESEASDGIEIIKKIIRDIEKFSKAKNYKIKFLYLGAPNYHLEITSNDYKTAEKQLKDLTDFTLTEISKSNAKGEFLRK